MKSLLIVLLALATSAFAGDADEVRRLDQEATVATWTADALWFQDNLADQFVLITPKGETRSKRDVIGSLADPGFRMEPYDASDVELRLLGDTAVVTGRMLQRFSRHHGEPRHVNDLRYTNVYVKRKGRWLLLSAHRSRVER